MSTGHSRWVAVVAAVAVLVAAAVFVARAFSAQGSGVQTAVAAVASSQKRVSAAGRVAGQRDELVYPAVQATVKRILVSDQQRVEKGDVLVELDDEPYRVAKAQAQAAIRQAEATERTVDSQAPSAQTISAGRDAVDAASAQRGLARKNLKDAIARGANAATVRSLRVAKKGAEAGYTQATAALAALRTASDTSEQDRAAASALRAARNACAKAQHDIDSSVIRAPFSGTVLLLSSAAVPGASPAIVVGQGVSPQAPLLRIVDLAALKFVADVDQDDIALVRVGQSARVSLDASPSVSREASVTFVGVASKTTGAGVTAFTVETSLPSGAVGLRLGMEGTVDIVVDGGFSAVRVSQGAVTRRDGATSVFVVESGIARLRRVTLGTSSGGEYEITSGLRAGDTVVTSGAGQLTDGARVAKK